MKNTKFIISIVLFLGSLLLCQQVIYHSSRAQSLKQDYADINHAEYGLFSVGQWKGQLGEIISAEVQNLNLSGQQGKDLKKVVEGQLTVLIDKIYQRIEKKNSRTAEGFVKQSLMDTFVDVKDLKKGVPEYADAMVKELAKDKNESRIKRVASQKIKELMDKTRDIQAQDEVGNIIKKTGADSVPAASQKIQSEIEKKNTLIYWMSMGMIMLALAIFAIPGFCRDCLQPREYVLLTLTLLVLLIAGVTTPMIDIEAKISELSFMLLGHEVKFENQIMYFQSKSILDVFVVMIKHQDIKMKFVGILVVTFSVLFPIVKMISSMIYYYNFRNWRDSRVVQFFVMKSGKWSMADVLVVAIFMAYIGFNGIINAQLEKLAAEAEDIDLFTTNGTALQPGFYIFLTYALLAMFLSGFLKRKPREAI